MRKINANWRDSFDFDYTPVVCPQTPVSQFIIWGIRNHCVIERVKMTPCECAYFGGGDGKFKTPPAKASQPRY